MAEQLPAAVTTPSTAKQRVATDAADAAVHHAAAAPMVANKLCAPLVVVMPCKPPPVAVMQNPNATCNEPELREAPPGLDTDAMALWRAIDSLDDVLGRDFVDALLAETAIRVCDENVDDSSLPVPRKWRGLPYGTHYHTILRELRRWGGSGMHPLTFATGPLLPCSATAENGDVTNEVQGAENMRASTLAVARAARERSPESFREALQLVGAAGIARLLGCRETPGSVAGALPPPRAALAAAARVRVGRKRGARISVSARALMKHCGRMGEGWGTCYWGSEAVVMNGNDDEKNARAEGVIEQVLDQCVWMNIHHAPGGTRVLELRVASGHGVRWHAADAVFRGFLEPHSKALAVRKKEERKNRFKQGDYERTEETKINAESDASQIDVGNKDDAPVEENQTADTSS